MANEKTALALPMEDDRFFHELAKLIPRLRRMALGMTGSVATGNEIVRSACRQALTRYTHMTPGTLLDRWLFGLIADECLSAAHIPDEGYAIAASPPQMTRALGAVGDFLAGLDANDRVAVVMSCVEGARYAEVAKRLSISVDEAHARLAAARATLADKLNPESVGERTPPLDDTAMIALVDNELDDIQAAEIDRLVRAQSAGGRLAALRHTTTAIRAAINEPMQEPVPTGLLDLIEAHKAGRSRAAEHAQMRFVRIRKFQTAAIWTLAACTAAVFVTTLFVATSG